MVREVRCLVEADTFEPMPGGRETLSAGYWMPSAVNVRLLRTIFIDRRME